MSQAILLLQDFKEAARLSAEAKTAVLEADKNSKEAAGLAEKVKLLEKEEQSAVLEIQDGQALVDAARLALVRARYHLLQVCT